MTAESNLRGLWHAALAERDVIAADFANLKDLIGKKFAVFLSNPTTLRELFAGLRSMMPVVVLPGFAVVTKYADVVEVLRDDLDFGVTEIYAAKMQATSGAFFLGMENTPQYQRESAIARQAARPADLDRIRALVSSTADELIRAAAPSGRLDAVGGFSRLVPARVVSEYFGVPGPDLATQLRWMRTIFWEIFIDFGNSAPVRDAAAASSREMAPYLMRLIAQRRNEIAAGRAAGDDVLTRLVRMQGDAATHLDDDGIRRNIGGIVVGAVDTTSKAVANALDQLLDRPDALAAAQQAARAGDDTLVGAYIFEALRFNPQNPFLLRHCRNAHVVGKGTPSEKQIPKGVTVLAATLSAMFDGSIVASPDEFRAGRPPENYLHFGAGLHTCFGELINRVQIPTMMKSLLKLRNLRRAPGPDGTMVSEGPFPDRLIVLFDRD